jgi:hypothetical protein
MGVPAPLPNQHRTGLKYSGHAAAISCCVLPFARASTWSLRVDEVRLPTAGCSALVRGRLGRGAAAAFVAAVGVLAAAVFLDGGPLL